ncbi:MAG: molybdopterin cofactor-binding domain-containing protein [Bryobacteraceae bacterium]|jgi:isoquinoline 1-oxidoreductase
MRPEDLSRRDFLVTGTGLFVFSHAGPLGAQPPATGARRGGYPVDFNAYLRIGADGRVTCLVGKVELGQGETTALAQCLADELDVAYDSVDMLMGDTEICPWDSGTGSSTGIQVFSLVLRRAAAEARAVLLQMAAEQLHAPVERLKVDAGVVTDPEQGKRIAYAQMVQGKRIERHLGNVPLKSPAEFRLIGRTQPWKGAVDVVTGKTKYTGDISVPGMLCARILRPPAHGATLKNVDTSAAEKAGARVVRAGDLIAVLHERRDVADAALRLVKAQFEPPPTGPDDRTIFDHLLKTAPPAALFGEKGDPAEGEKLAAQIVEETYLNGYVAHAAMETHSAVAAFEDGKFTVWASTQGPFQVKQQIADALGVSPESVRVIAPVLGGGFGGKSSVTPLAARQAQEAARLARAAGTPVQVVWDRAEEFFYTTFRPAAVVKIRAGLSGAGKIVSWVFEVCGAGNRDSISVYDIPNQRTTYSGSWQDTSNPPGMHPFFVGAWRGPSANTNTFARESHLDALAVKAGVDPVEFRLNHLTDQRLRRALETAAKQFGWKPAKAPSGRGVGMACGTYKNDSRMVTMAEVAVDKQTGRVQVKRVVCVMDQGLTANPEGSHLQLEGGIIMGLGYALMEEIHFKGGEIHERDFDTYNIPRFSWVPKIETFLMDNPSTPPAGCGEPPAITVGALIANAIFDAVGVRLFQLPMTPERVRAAIQGA